MSQYLPTALRPPPIQTSLNGVELKPIPKAVRVVLQIQRIQAGVGQRLKRTPPWR